MAVFDAYHGCFSYFILPEMTWGGYPSRSCEMIYRSRGLFMCMALNCHRASCVRTYALCLAFCGSYFPRTELRLISREMDDWYFLKALAISSCVYPRRSRRNISFLSQSENREKVFLLAYIQSYSHAIQNGN